MRARNSLSHKVQLLSNRVRCSNCNADSTEALFMVTDELRFRSSVIRAKQNAPMFMAGWHNPKLRLNKTQRLESNEVLTRVCLRCGQSRRTSIPHTGA
jgi:hypothetical protein